MNKDISKASDIIAKIFDTTIEKNISSALSISSIWNEVMEEKISAHSKIIDIKNGNLLVAVDHPGWSFQILLKKKEIIRRINAEFPEKKLKGISFTKSP